MHHGLTCDGAFSAKPPADEGNLPVTDHTPNLVGVLSDKSSCQAQMACKDMKIPTCFRYLPSLLSSLHQFVL